MKKKFRVSTSRLPRKKVRKRVDAAAIVFEAETFEPLLDEIARTSESFERAVKKRRGNTKSMTIFATNTRSETPGKGESIESLLSMLAVFRATYFPCWKLMFLNYNT